MSLRHIVIIGLCVYLFKKVSSLEKDWPRPVVSCEKCKKTLTPGSHAEHEGKPYCKSSCYPALFGPGGFGKGGTESYRFDTK
ncbi:cysteine-rich protein 1-like [Ruditapes philippinarum]|uniref:cysteine-rich protein 1-like n=1 Tax=Ruditapes philippinarum TaxID=129788 RepID=UPI00295C149E|nr:cysteine-rich protein 1-like [Ruditapes philippinarum]